MRVGGGFICFSNADDFIQRYGKMEMMKKKKQDELKESADNPFGAA